MNIRKFIQSMYVNVYNLISLWEETHEHMLFQNNSLKTICVSAYCKHTLTIV